LAGEVTGKGKSLKLPDGTLHGKSACAFSGLNDTFTGDPNVPDADGFFRTQNWGQIDKQQGSSSSRSGSLPGRPATRPPLSPDTNQANALLPSGVPSAPDGGRISWRRTSARALAPEWLSDARA